MYKENYRKVNLKRKVFSKGKKRNFKRFKKTPKFIKDNPENKIAREKDVYCFTDSGEDDNDLGMGLEISDLPILDENHADRQRELMALTQDSVRPLFTDETYDENKLEEGLAELKISSFRPNQKETIKRILYGRSTLFISPTGSGKSLCYLIPALLYWRYRKYMTIVVSPLISLMEDQMRNFPASLKAVCLHSGHNMMQRRKSIEQLVQNEAQVAFISPEAIVSGLLTVEDLKNLPPVGFVCIDEAHCLSEWSHNFRPAYMQFFRILNEQMNIKTFLGITATATKATAFAIARSLIINPETDVIGSTTIPENLILSVSYETNKEKALIDLLQSATFRILTSIIVYCNRREETERVASRIRTSMQNYANIVEVPEKVKKSSNDDSIKSNDSNSSLTSEKAHMKLSWHAEAYHAGLSTETRKRIQRQFIKGEVRVVVATIAFGMGINKSNVRAIIHYDLPSSFESYVQEIGRAGRDDKPAQCHMFLQADKSDLYYQQRNIYASVTESKNLKKLIDYLFRPPCTCTRKYLNAKERNRKLEKRNQIDQHEIKRLHKTKFTNTEVGFATSDDDDDDDDDIESIPINEANASGEKENKPTKFVHKSIVKKHRECLGHEKSFSLDEAIEEINLKPESIITLICQLQKEYPQLQIKQFTPCKAICNLFCYHGAKQMQALAESSKPVGTALFQYKLEHLKASGTKPEIPQKLSFNYIDIATILGKPSADIARMLKKTEWELDDKTGRFKRSQVKVNFEGNYFHFSAVGDLNNEELDELNDYLFDFSKLYENIEREKLARVFNTFRRHSIDLKNMEDKDSRLDVSSRLKTALMTYFDSASEQQILPIVSDNQNMLNEAQSDDLDEEAAKILKIKEQNIRKNTRAFISAHCKSDHEFKPRIIARIFQGISTPNYPAEHWGMNKKWWRIHLDVDFHHLVSIIQKELL